MSQTGRAQVHLAKEPLTTDTSTARAIGTALIVSEDTVATRQIAEAMQELALSVEVCIKVSDAMDRVNYSKLEVAVIDFSLENQAALLLVPSNNYAVQPRSNRAAVAFAITSSSVETAYALKAGSSFALDRPLTFESLRHTLQAAYGMIVREPSLLPLSHFRSGSRQQERGIRNLWRNGECQRTRRSIQRVQRRLDPARR
jgi:ActR/RegA family two-component response regulator